MAKGGKWACLPRLNPLAKAHKKSRWGRATIIEDTFLKPWPSLKKNDGGQGRSVDTALLKPKNCKILC